MKQIPRWRSSATFEGGRNRIRSLITIVRGCRIRSAGNCWRRLCLRRFPVGKRRNRAQFRAHEGESKMVKVYETPKGKCPTCGYEMDRAISIARAVVKPPPTPGTLTMCCGCGELLVFLEDMTVGRAPEGAEQQMPPQVRELVTKARMFFMERNQKPQMN